MRPWPIHVVGKNIKKTNVRDNNGQDEQIMAPSERNRVFVWWAMDRVLILDSFYGSIVGLCSVTFVRHFTNFKFY